MGLILGLGRRAPGEGNDNALQQFSPGKYHVQRSVAGYRPWGHKRAGHD